MAAEYVNGATWRCDLLPSYALYAYEIEGAPFRDGAHPAGKP